MSPRLTSLGNMRLSETYNNACFVASSVSSLYAIVYLRHNSTMQDTVLLKSARKNSGLFIRLIVISGIELFSNVLIFLDVKGERTWRCKSLL